MGKSLLIWIIIQIINILQIHKKFHIQQNIQEKIILFMSNTKMNNNLRKIILLNKFRKSTKTNRKQCFKIFHKANKIQFNQQNQIHYH